MSSPRAACASCSPRWPPRCPAWCPTSSATAASASTPCSPSTAATSSPTQAEIPDGAVLVLISAQAGG
ncbi:MAG: hypothetical protein IPO88_14445 [Nannocystis sp.]|uniref:hypothetical protein n=1 Tax=Nannocystis sp. TaxID=1962667 RepID=UPI00242091D5|nr:hypothetical protein [Nannocystis sp.]MBK9754672.1 hypothetical protein [Nannocystis sp.]